MSIKCHFDTCFPDLGTKQKDVKSLRAVSKQNLVHSDVTWCLLNLTLPGRGIESGGRQVRDGGSGAPHWGNASAFIGP